MEQRKKTKFDLTSGPILSKILMVAVPIMGTQLVQMSYNLTDIFWLGRLGSDAVAASGTCGLFMWMAYGLILFGRLGAEIGVSQNLGRSDVEGARRHAQNAVYIAVFFGLLYSLCMFFFRYQLIGFFNIPSEKVAGDARRYLMIISFSLPFDFLYNVAVGAFNASGNSRTPFIIGTIGLISNMIMDPLMIFGLNLGITGAALATAIAQIFCCILIFTMLKKSKNRPFETFRLFSKPDFAIIRQLLKWSVPPGLESMFFTFMAMITSRFTAAFGASAMAVSRVGSQIESLSWLIGGGFGTAMTSYIGQNYGAGKWTRIHKGFHISMRVILCWGVLITAFIYLGARLLFSVFLSDPSEIALGVTYLQIIAWCQLPQSVEAIAYSMFKGTGNTVPPSIVSTSCNILRVILSYVLSRSSLGLNGIWVAISVAAVIRGAWIYAWCKIQSRKYPKTDALAVS